MLRRIAGFFKRLFSSKRFRIVVRTLFWMMVVYFVFSFVWAIIRLSSLGFPPQESIPLLLEMLFWVPDETMLLSSVSVGIVLGLIWYFYRRWSNRSPEEEPEETGEKAKEEPPAAPAQEEEPIIETKHYTFR